MPTDDETTLIASSALARPACVMQHAPSNTQRILGEESELPFELGGPAYRIMQRIGVIRGQGPSVERRCLIFIAITWVPMLLFAALQGHAIGPTPRESFLLDFATYARLFLAVPLIFAAEVVVGPRLRAAGLRFLEGDIVRPESLPDFAAAVARVVRRREAVLPELVFLIVAFFTAWLVSVEQIAGLGSTSWHTVFVGGQTRFSLAGYGTSSLPCRSCSSSFCAGFGGW